MLILAGAVAIGTSRQLIYRRRARRALRRHPPLSLQSPEGSTARVTGIALVADGTLVAPLSGRNCLVARSSARAGGGIFDPARRPKETIVMVPFLLDRGPDGTVRIEGAHALLDLPPITMIGSEVDLPRRMRFLTTLDLPAKQVRKSSFEETLVEPGDRITVAGLVMRDLAEEPAGDERSYRDAPPTTLRIAGNIDHPLAIGRPLD